MREQHVEQELVDKIERLWREVRRLGRQMQKMRLSCEGNNETFYSLLRDILVRQDRLLGGD
jgi:hypothetical protein